MNIRDAWNSCNHGGFIVRPIGSRIEKWMGDKPGLPPSFSRWLDENVLIVPIDDIMAGDWEVGT